MSRSSLIEDVPSFHIRWDLWPFFCNWNNISYDQTAQQGKIKYHYEFRICPKLGSSDTPIVNMIKTSVSLQLQKKRFFVNTNFICLRT